MLRFRGSQNFRQRLLLSTLSGKPIRIDDIRAGDQSPGLRDYEASLLRLLEKLTNGCLVEINETGVRRAPAADDQSSSHHSWLWRLCHMFL
jgi:RNA 3'-terminal phosphate cyclase-like protein